MQTRPVPLWYWCDACIYFIQFFLFRGLDSRMDPRQTNRNGRWKKNKTLLSSLGIQSSKKEQRSDFFVSLKWFTTMTTAVITKVFRVCIWSTCIWKYCISLTYNVVSLFGYSFSTLVLRVHNGNELNLTLKFCLFCSNFIDLTAGCFLWRVIFLTCREIMDEAFNRVFQSHLTFFRCSSQSGTEESAFTIQS